MSHQALTFHRLLLRGTHHAGQYGHYFAGTTLAEFSVGALTSWIVGKSVFSLPAFECVFLQSVLASATVGVLMYSLPSSFGITWLLAKKCLGLCYLCSDGVGI